MILSKKVEG